KGGVKMKVTNSILKDVRSGVGLGEDVTAFDLDLIMHINAAIGKLNQNGVGLPLLVYEETQTWEQLMDPLQLQGNLSFGLVPLFITLSTKIIFDPPPPSVVEYHSRSINELLWRLKV